MKSNITFTRKPIGIVKSNRLSYLRKKWQLYSLILLPLVWLLLFKYIPMYGAQIAFRRFNVLQGIWGSPWIGMDNFIRFFSSYVFWRVLKNTLLISSYTLFVGFPLPIILALSLNYVKNRRFGKTIQMVSYAPHFISTVVMVGMLLQFLAERTGIVNNLIVALGGTRTDFMGRAELFSSIYVLSDVWKNVGYGSIVYLAALSGIDPEMHEAAIVDGATKVQRVWHIDIPGILPTVVILLILRTGRIMELGFEKIFLMQNPINLKTAEVIQTYVYKVGIASDVVNFSYATAIGLFRSIINLILILSVNRIASKLGETSLW